MSGRKFRGLAAALLLSVCLFVAAGFNEAQALTPRGAWSASVTYALDDIVILRGSTWRSKHNTNKGKLPGQTSPTSTAADWELFASGFNPLGAWKGTTTYQKNDVVLAANGAVYRALRTNANKTPGLPANTADWAVFVLRGATGAQGPQGAAGPGGPQGPPGVQGPAGSSAVADGTASAPSFNFTSSPNTGIFSPGGGKIALVQNGELFLHNNGPESVALGANALGDNTTGVYNTAVGQNALRLNTQGNYNVAIGRNSLRANLTGGSNTAVGDDSLRYNDAGGQNTAVGLQTLYFNNGNRNTALGYYALTLNSAGNDNTAVGASALASNDTGEFNTAVGRQALETNETGNSNVAVGSIALQDSTGNSNTGIGVASLSNTTTGQDNTAVGHAALLNNTTGSNNVAIGKNAGVLASAPASSIFIGNLGASLDTTTIKIGAQGTQTTAFIAGIRSVTTGANNAVGVVIDSNGQLGTVSSSRRYKEDIQPMGAMSDMLAALRPVSFRYKKPYADGSKPIQYGLIAEEVADTFPYLAVFNADGRPETVKYHELPAFLLEGFQEQQKVIAAQAEQLSEQRASIETLMQQNARQQASLDAQAERTAALEESLRRIEAQLARPSITAASDSP